MTDNPQTTDLCECLTCGRQHKSLGFGSPPWAINHDDACRLSRGFNETADLRRAQDLRINEWLKRLIGSLYHAE
jgi:hypothetical protein